MADKLTSNVEVDGTWYGPGYPQNGDPPAGSVTNPAAFATPEEAAADSASAVDLRFRKDDFNLADDEDSPSLREGENAALAPGGADLEAPPRTGAGSGKDAWKDYATARGVTDLPADATKEDIIAALEARGLA